MLEIRKALSLALTLLKTILGTKDDATSQGACLDTEAQTTVIELKQVEAYCMLVGIEFKPEINSSSYRLGSER